VHTGYKVGGDDKRIAYEIAVGEGRYKKQGIIYITHGLVHNDFVYFNEKEGISPLITISDKLGRELYGAYVPLQSLKKKDGDILVTSGSKDGPGSFPFPQNSTPPLFYVQIAYIPSKLIDRSGDAEFQVWPYGIKRDAEGKPIARGKVSMGAMFNVGDYSLSVQEVRYWAAMMVRYEPGKSLVLVSLWVGLTGMIITFIGRIRKGRVEGKDS
jgi:hypothetical protein